MKKIFKSIFGKKENDIKSYDSNSLVDVKQKLSIIQKKEHDNLNMLKDLSLSEKEYFEREIFFKYDCDDYKIINIVRKDSKSFDVFCKIFTKDEISEIKENIKYEDIKDKNNNF